MPTKQKPQQMKAALAATIAKAASKESTSETSMAEESQEFLPAVNVRRVTSTPESGDHSPANSSVALNSVAFRRPNDNSRFQECPTLGEHCGWLWEIFEKPYSIPVWFVLMATPISALVMAGLYMHSCPGATILPLFIFLIGISLTVVYLLKVYFIVYKMANDVEPKGISKTVFGIAAILAMGVFGTESVYYWKLDSTAQSESSSYCDPEFTKYVFWWNCLMWVNMLSIIFC